MLEVVDENIENSDIPTFDTAALKTMAPLISGNHLIMNHLVIDWRSMSGNREKKV